MARLQLSKSSLAREAKNLRTFERFLPSLDLKRQQLMAERVKAVAALAATRGEIKRFNTQIGQKLPMLANLDIDLLGLVTLTGIKIGTENVVGTHLPVLDRIDVEVKPYPLLAMPHWVDNVTAMLHDMLELHMRAQVEERRVVLLEAAVKTITQRVNLFDKVLIPRARANIKRIRIYLSDEEMAAVVRSKLSKRKNAAAGAA